MLRKMKLYSLVLLVGFFITACGQKGPLYKSPDKQDNQKQKVEQPKKQSIKE
ncbi:lipoprotein [Shewanella sp. D64]|uniref:LPS translocon maturation chaperone LptM n=1 Tax=unclassified Shewanella TaxID=196818 RepID=UPI0022BA5C08|nr:MULTISPECIES: lipoprotein [unclassified Shewanella]MEC4726173.1 lipoprotein [Shewanella sp. D64]MEC4737911.1 lipoprotein [Shewanella sp. E94]WBJ96114.1 lipoprotein [Shewanella sp. MTB7]